MATSLGTYTILVDWLGSGNFTGSDDDITSRVYEAEWTRGRDYASQLVGRSVAGRLTLRLRNADGRFNSFNANSTLFGSILPGRRVRIRSGGPSAFPYDFPIVWVRTVWQGFLERIIPEPSIGGQHTAILEAIGPLGYINQRNVEQPMLSSVRTDTAIGTILDRVGWPSADRDLSTGQTTMTRFFLGEVQALDALRRVEDTEDGFLYEDKVGKVVFHDRQKRLTGTYQTSQATFSDNATGTLLYQAVVQEDPLPFVYNNFKASVQIFTTGTSTVLWTMPTTGTASPFLVRNGGSGTFWARFPNPDSATEAIAVDVWTTPVATTDYTFSSDQAGTGTNLNSLVTVSVSKFATAMKIVVTNTGTADGYLSAAQARGVAVLRSDPIAVSVEDGTSGTKFGERHYPHPGEFIPSVSEAMDWANVNLTKYKDPRPILAVTFLANRSSTAWEAALAKDIAYRVTVHGTGSSDLGVAEDFFIEAEHHRVDSGRVHQVTYYLSPASVLSDFWVLNTSELGTRTRVAY